MNQIAETAEARQEAKRVLTDCLDDIGKLAIVDQPILSFIMEIGAPQQFKEVSPDDYLIDGIVQVDITPRSKKLAIKKALSMLDALSMEQLKLFAKGDLNNTGKNLPIPHQPAKLKPASPSP